MQRRMEKVIDLLSIEQSQRKLCSVLCSRMQKKIEEVLCVISFHKHNVKVVARLLPKHCRMMNAKAP